MNTRSFPSFEDVYEKVDRFVEKNSEISRSESLGASVEGREIRAVFVTDKSVPVQDKEVAVVVCGRHGNELGTRVVGTARVRSSRDGLYPVSRIPRGS